MLSSFFFLASTTLEFSPSSPNHYTCIDPVLCTSSSTLLQDLSNLFLQHKSSSFEKDHGDLPSGFKSSTDLMLHLH